MNDEFKFEQNKDNNTSGLSIDSGKDSNVFSNPSAGASQSSPKSSPSLDKEIYLAALEKIRKEPKKSFKTRHPKLYWVFMLISVFFVFNILGSVWSVLDYNGVLSGPRLAILRVEGMILNSESIVKWAAELEKNPSVHGILVRIDSPGGSVVPSQEIHAAIKRLAAKKPVVVSMGSAAASGGYYVAVASEYIVANPSTLTGSIGVKMEIIEAEELMKTVGIKNHGLSTGALKEAGSPYRSMTDAEKVYLDGLIQDMYECFVLDVAKGRNMSVEKVKEFSDGRAFTGLQAKKLGLVDDIGDMDFAMRVLAKRSNMQDLPSEILDGPRQKTSMFEELLSMLLSVNMKNLANAAKENVSGYKFYY